MNERILATLTAADPARDVPVGPGDVEALLRRASHDITNYEPHTPVRRRRVLVAAAAILAVAAVTGATVAVMLRGADQPPADPVVPVVPAPSVVPGCLDRLAEGVRPAPYDSAKGTFEYLRTSSLSGSTVQMKNGAFATMQYQVETSTWTAADGSQRRRTVTGEITYADETSRAFFRANPDMLPAQGTSTVDVPAVETSRPQLPAADPAAMADALYQPRENGPSQAIVGVQDLVRGRVLDLPHRQAMLRFLARTEGVFCRLEQGDWPPDPVGRNGILVSAPVGAGPAPSPGDNGMQLLLVDPATGDVLAAGYAGGTEIIWSDVYLERGFTDQRPAVTR